VTELFDPTGDFEQVVDGLEAVTLAPADGTPAIELLAMRRSPTAQEIGWLRDAMGLKLDDIVWHFSAAALGGYEPAAGDTITDGAGVVWTIAGLSRQLLRRHWRAICQAFVEP
jgi:hypothetical protein